MTEESKVEVSVIIPCYNHGHFLHIALESIVAQTFTQWEAIVVDDGSIDSTAIVAKSHTDGRVRYIYQENAGLPAARNTGIRVAKGRYLAFLDADDQWEPSFIEYCINNLKNEDSLAGVFTRCLFIDADGHVLPGIGGRTVSSEDFRKQILEGGFFPIHAALIRKTAMKKSGLFDTSLTSLEDWDLWIRISDQFSMRGLPEPLACYRVYPGSMSTNITRMHENRILVLTKYYGPPKDYPIGWPDEKRMAYAFAYRSTAISLLLDNKKEEAWEWLRRAVMVWPLLLTRLDTYYELSCGNQQKGYRGRATQAEIEANGQDMLRRMDELFDEGKSNLSSLRSAAYGNSYLALAMLSDQAGDWTAARRYMQCAIRANPNLLRDPMVVRRFLKLLLGQRVTNNVHRMRHKIRSTATR